MNMTEGEICRQYRSAKDRASQLQILADLNCVPRLEIIKILMHNGEQVRLPLAAKGKKRTTELTDEEYTAHCLDGWMYLIGKSLKEKESTGRLWL